jgi:putative toxin-antitoxin system antitoxin component (TIGR02293 family)
MGTPSAGPESRVIPPRGILRRKSQPAAAGKGSGVGVVQFCVQGSAASSASPKFSPAKLVEVLQVGLPFRELEALQASLSVPTETLAPMLGISKATFHRRKGDASRLTPAVSDRVVRYARLLGQALRVFEGLEAAKQWLNTPQVGLGGAVPLNYARTELGAREVENLLGRIEYGVYS